MPSVFRPVVFRAVHRYRYRWRRSLNLFASSPTFSPRQSVPVGLDNIDDGSGSERGTSLPTGSLEGRVNENTLKALMDHPLQPEMMTLVQEHVTALLPGLVRPRDPEGIMPPKKNAQRPPPMTDFPRDILVRAKTGSGKTFAYIVPAIECRLNHIEHNAKLTIINTGFKSLSDAAGHTQPAYRCNSVGSLILAPTRELALQIANDAQKLTMHQSNFQVQLLVGGARKAQQMRDWTESPRDLVIATPGRLRDLLTNEPEFRQGFKNCPLLILDEADTLLSMGFRDDIDAIVSFLPRSPIRQTFLFSATMPRAVRQLASWILSSNHTFVDATLPPPGSASPRSGEHFLATHVEHTEPCEDVLSAHDHIQQFYIMCPTASDQLPTILKLLVHDQLVHGPSSKVIVFCPTVQITELFFVLLRSLAEMLPNDTTEIVRMHSKMKQLDRDQACASFRNVGISQKSKPIVLVGSDVGARGVDYSGVTRVIQVGIPSKKTQYIHRIRRMIRGIDSFAFGKGKGDGTPTTRADLLLLSWEAGYINWRLTDLPIKSLPISIIDSQLASFPSRSPTAEFLKTTSAEIQRRVNPADVRKAAASLLGYYLPLTPSLRLQPSAVLAGVSTWASECFDVSLPAVTRFPRKFVEAYERSTQSKKMKGLFVDRLKIASPSPLGKAKSKNHSVWEGASIHKKPKRWY